jgi:hypothetical protein
MSTLLAGILDLLSSKLGLWPPVYVRIAGLRGTVSFMALEPEELQKWQVRGVGVEERWEWGGW